MACFQVGAALEEANAAMRTMREEHEANLERLGDAVQLLEDKNTLEDVVRQQVGPPSIRVSDASRVWTVPRSALPLYSLRIRRRLHAVSLREFITCWRWCKHEGPVARECRMVC